MLTQHFGSAPRRFLLKIGLKVAEINTSEKTCRVKNTHEEFTEVYCGN